MNKTNLKNYLRRMIALGLPILLLSGCQPTPDTDVIAQKDDINKVVEQYAQDDSDGGAADAPDADDAASGDTVSGGTLDGSGDTSKADALRQSIGAPQTASFVVSIENVGDGSTKVTAEKVPIILPNADKLGSAVVVRNDLSAEQIKALADKFFDGRTAYEQMPETKEDLMEQIRLMQQSYDENLEMGVSEEQLEWIKEQIKIVETEMAAAPAKADVVLEPADFQWKNLYGVNGLESIYGSCTDNGIDYTLSVQREASFYFLSLTKTSVEEDKTRSSYPASRESLKRDMEVTGAYANFEEKIENAFSTNKCKYTEGQAVSLCMEFLDDYDIARQDLAISEIIPLVEYNYETGELGEGIESYKIYMTHAVGGVAQTQAGNPIAYQPSEENDGKVAYDYEYILFEVDDLGVSSFIWSNPMSMGEILADQVKLMDYNAIEEIIKNHIGLAYESYKQDEQLRGGMSLDVDYITLGMMRIQNKNNEENYTLIPVWDVFSKQLGDYSLVTINAMDGSIISRENGY